MKVLIADQFEPSGIDGIKAAGCEVIYQPALADQLLADALAATRPDVLVVRSTKVTEAMLPQASLSLIVRAGAGVNTIDVAAASRRGIYVSNCPGRNSIAVAELTFGLILALDRRIPDNVADLRAGRWNKEEYSKARGLFGRTLGILGFGSIGQEVARRAAAFGMPVVVWSRSYKDSLKSPEDVAAVLKEFDGYYVVRLVKCDGVPAYSNGGLYDGVDETSFRGAFLNDCMDVLSTDLLNEAWESKFPEAAIAYGKALLKAADLPQDEGRTAKIPEPKRSFLSRLGFTKPARQAEPVPIAEQLEIVRSAGRWYVFWGERGHPIRAWF